MQDCGKCTVTNFVEFYFDKTIRMMEFSGKDGYDGKNKVCSQCDKECIFVQEEDQQVAPSKGDQDAAFLRPRVYYECIGGDAVKGCKRVICDECQNFRIRSFECRPQLSVNKIGIELSLISTLDYINREHDDITEENKNEKDQDQDQIQENQKSDKEKLETPSKNSEFVIP